MSHATSQRARERTRCLQAIGKCLETHVQCVVTSECSYQHFSLLHQLFLGSSSPSFSLSRYAAEEFGSRFGCDWRGRAAVRFAGPSPAVSLRASTTRRTSTVHLVSHVSAVICDANLTRKSLLNVDHLPRTRLHEAALSPPRPLETRLGFYLSLAL